MSLRDRAAQRAEELSRDIDALASCYHLAEVDLYVGEEPEEGVEFDVVALPPGVELP